MASLLGFLVLLLGVLGGMAEWRSDGVDRLFILIYALEGVSRGRCCNHESFCCILVETAQMDNQQVLCITFAMISYKQPRSRNRRSSSSQRNFPSES